MSDSRQAAIVAAVAAQGWRVCPMEYEIMLPFSATSKWVF